MGIGGVALAASCRQALGVGDVTFTGGAGGAGTSSSSSSKAQTSGPGGGATSSSAGTGGATTSGATTSSSSGGMCGSGMKMCGGSCVSVDDAAYGCSPSSCTPCALPHATPICTGGACALGPCDTGYSDCNGTPDDGCETDTSTDASSCGACGHACPNDFSCDSGQCACIHGLMACLNGICSDGSPNYCLCNGTNAHCNPGQICGASGSCQ